jgi:hypothetical protein
VNICTIPCAAELWVEFVSYATYVAAEEYLRPKPSGSTLKRANVCTAVVGIHTLALAYEPSGSEARFRCEWNSGLGANGLPTKL